MAIIHRPVLLGEVVKWIDRGEGTYLDLTVGDGGHSEAILSLIKNSKLIGIDRDSNSISTAEERLAPFCGRYKLFNARFSEVPKILDEIEINGLSGVIADLGLSSRQLEIADRGFSFQNDGPLDMRMGRSKITAYDIINTWPEKELADLFYNFGEERLSRRIAKKICLERKKEKIKTTLTLASVVASVVPRNFKINPATKVFQALRIAVNSEIDELRVILNDIPARLKGGGRFLVISYHSLEDREVKNEFRGLKNKGFMLSVKKPIVPSDEEIKDNRRARSAKMRVLERAS